MPFIEINRSHHARIAYLFIKGYSLKTRQRDLSVTEGKSQIDKKLMKSALEKNQFTTYVLLLCILLVRLIPVFYIAMVHYQGLVMAGDWDAMLYLGGAREILTSGTNQFNFFPPLNFLFIALFLYLSHGNLIVPMLALSVMGWLTVIGVYLLAKDLFGERVARVSAIVSGLYPNFIFFNISFYSETLAIFFIIWSIFLLIRFYRTSAMVPLLLSGVLWGLASLSRGGLNYFSLLIAGAISFHPLKERCGVSIKSAGIFLMMMVFSFFILSSLIPDRLGSTSLGSKSGIGSVIHGTNRLIVCCTDYGNVRGNILYAINNCREAWPPGSQLDMLELIKLPAGQMYAKLFKFIAEDPFIYIKNSFLKLSNFWAPNQYVIDFIKNKLGPGNNPHIIDAVCFIIALLYVGVVCGGLLGIAFSMDPFRPVFITFIIFYCLLIFFTVGNSKLRLPLMPFFIIYCSYFIMSFKDGAWKRAFSNKLILFIVLLFLSNSIYKFREIMLSPNEILVRKVELCNQLGFPKTALFYLRQKGYGYTESQTLRMDQAEAVAQKKVSAAPAEK